MSAITLGPVGLAWAGLLVVGVLGFALATGVNLIKDGLVASARTTAQLLGVGLILNPVFARESWLLIVLVLLHKGKGGGLSDLFGGGVSTSLGGSSVAERNLDRVTVGVGLIWAATIIALGLITKS